MNVRPASRTQSGRNHRLAHTTTSPSAGQRVMIETAPVAGEAERTSRRERDIAAFRERRRQAADEARAEARRADRAGGRAGVRRGCARRAGPSGRQGLGRGAPGARAGASRRADRRGWSGRATVAVGDQPRCGAELAPGQARSGSRARGMRRLRDHRAPTAKRAAQRAAHPRRGARSPGQAARVLALSGRRRGNARTAARIRDEAARRMIA